MTQTEASTRPQPRSLPGLPWRYRAAVLSRLLAAFVGGYLLASAVAASCALFLPMARAQATVSGSMLGLLVYALAFMTVFACRTAARAWLSAMGPALLLGAALWLARGSAAGWGV